MSEQVKYKHNFCLSFSVMSNQAPDAVSADEMREVISEVLKEDDEGMLLSVRLEDSENLRPLRAPARRVEVVLRPTEGVRGTGYVAHIEGMGDVRVSLDGGKMQGSVSNLQKPNGREKDRC